MSRPPLAVTFAELPLYARIAIEWADNNTEYRNTAGINRLCAAYARSTGAEFDHAMADAAVEIARRRFWNFETAETFRST
jgi:hypothetical protein